jgi:hypothetical protein
MNLGSMRKDDSYVTGSRFFLGCGIALAIGILLVIIALGFIAVTSG